MVMAMNLIFIVIGTAFGVEWRHHRFDSSPYPSKHFFYHVVAPYQDGLGFNCGRAMPVTEMPGDPVEVVRRSASHLYQVLGCRLHRNPAATFQCKAVTIAQGRRFFEIEENRRLVIANKPDAPPMPRFVVEHHRADGIRDRPISPSCHSGCAMHQNRK
jgi:hypothetical protein